MKKHLSIICFLVFLFHVSFASHNNNPSLKEKDCQQETSTHIKGNYLIKGKKVGMFEIGQTIPNQSSLPNTFTMKKKVRKRMTEEGETEEVIYVIKENGIELLHIQPEYDYKSEMYTTTIQEIIVLSDKFETTEGISVNSTIEEFIKTYKKYTIWFTYISSMYVIDSPNVEGQFLLNEKDFNGKLEITSDMTILKKSNFKTNSAIHKIRIF